MNDVEKAEQAVKNAQGQIDSIHALLQEYGGDLIQILMEPLGAKKPTEPKVEEFDCPNGATLVVNDGLPHNGTGYNRPYPCKVTVTPLGEPGPVVRECSLGGLPYSLREQMYHRGIGDSEKVRVIVEEIE
mgnify:CR=1 FL=1